MAIEEAKNGETIVEIGAFKGMSTCYAGVEIQRRNPTLRFDVIDHFKGSEEHQGFGPGKFGKEFEKDPEYLYKEWLKNTEPVSRFVRAVKMDSKKLMKYTVKNLWPPSSSMEIIPTTGAKMIF